MRSALEAYLRDRENVKAIFMGTRRTDPHCEFLTHFNPTDKDWPQFMRVNPVIDWHYVEIWAVSTVVSLISRLGVNVVRFGAARTSDKWRGMLTQEISSSVISRFHFAAYISRASRHWAA